MDLDIVELAARVVLRLSACSASLKCLLGELRGMEWQKALGAPLDRHAEAAPPALLHALLHVFASDPPAGLRIMVDRPTALVSLQEVLSRGHPTLVALAARLLSAVCSQLAGREAVERLPALREQISDLATQHSGSAACYCAVAEAHLSRGKTQEAWVGSLVRRFSELVRSAKPDDRALGVDSLLLLSEQTLAVQAMLESDASIAPLLVAIFSSAADDVAVETDNQLDASPAEDAMLRVLRLLWILASHALGCGQLVSDVRTLTLLLDAAAPVASAEASAVVARIFEKLLQRPHSALVVVRAVGSQLVRYLSVMLSSMDGALCGASLPPLILMVVDTEQGLPLLIQTLGCVEMCLEVTRSGVAAPTLARALEVLVSVANDEQGALQCLEADGSGSHLLGLLAYPDVLAVRTAAELLRNLAHWRRGVEVLSACPHAVRTVAAGVWSADGVTVGALLATLRRLCAHPACAADVVSVPLIVPRLTDLLADPSAIVATSAAAVLACLAEHPAGRLLALDADASSTVLARLQSVMADLASGSAWSIVDGSAEAELLQELLRFLVHLCIEPEAARSVAAAHGISIILPIMHLAAHEPLVELAVLALAAVLVEPRAKADVATHGPSMGLVARLLRSSDDGAARAAAILAVRICDEVTTESAAELILQLGARLLQGTADRTAARHAALAMAGMSARAHLHWQQFAPTLDLLERALALPLLRNDADMMAHVARCARNLLSQQTFGLAASGRGMARVLVEVLASSLDAPCRLPLLEALMELTPHREASAELLRPAPLAMLARCLLDHDAATAAAAASIFGSTLRISAGLALPELPRVVPRLYELLRSSHPALVSSAAHALAMIGWHDRELRGEIDAALWERLPVLVDAAAAAATAAGNGSRRLRNGSPYPTVTAGAIGALALLASSRAPDLFAVMQPSAGADSDVMVWLGAAAAGGGPADASLLAPAVQTVANLLVVEAAAVRLCAQPTALVSALMAHAAAAFGEGAAASPAMEDAEALALHAMLGIANAVSHECGRRALLAVDGAVPTLVRWAFAHAELPQPCVADQDVLWSARSSNSAASCATPCLLQRSRAMP
jgi:hypothetical protein